MFYQPLKKLFVLSLFVFLFSAITPLAQAQDVEPDAKVTELLNKFMQALSIADEAESAKAVLPYLHKSVLNPAGTEISDDLKRFSFKKAHTGASLYAQPVKITRVRKTGQTQIGFAETAEAGVVYDYFISKKDGVTGMPAPVKVFVPSSEGAPKISYIGSI